MVRCLEVLFKKKNRKKNKPESLLSALGWVYVWSITEMTVCCKISRSVQVTWVTEERCLASADALERGLTRPVGSRVPKSSSL